MRLLLCSDYADVGYKFLNKFFDKTEGLTCLFVGYAQEDEFEAESRAVLSFKSMGMKVIILKEGYDFQDKIDLIFVRGGNTTRLIHHLHKFNQFEKIRKLVEEDSVLYIGSSAGSVLAGSDTEYCLRSEPYDYDVKSEFGKDSLKGYGWIDKMVFVHTTQHRMCYPDEMQNENDFFITNDTFCYPAHLEEIKIYDENLYTCIGNNQALFVDGEEKILLTDDWSNFEFREMQEKKQED